MGSLIQTPILIVIDVDFGPTDFGTPFPTNVIGLTDTQSVELDGDYLDSNGTPGVRSALLADTSGPFDSQLHSALPATSVPTDLGGVNSIDAPSANFRALGILPAVADPAGDLASLGPPPNTGFNSAFNFDFDPSDGIDSGAIDFDSVATHEDGTFARVYLRCGRCSVKSWTDHHDDTVDLFRFRAGTSINAFQTASRILSTGGVQDFFGGVSDIALATGNPNGQGGDGAQASHWKDDNAGGAYLGIMDPTIPSGARQIITDNDLAVLDLIGYSLKSNTQPTDELSVDDGSAENSGQLSGSIVLNRLTPVKYPSTLEDIKVFIRPVSGQSSPAGTRVRFLAYTAPDANTFTSSANPRPVVDQTIILPDVGTNGAFVDLHIPLGPTINSGDWYVGFQLSGAVNVAVGEDTNSTPHQQGFISSGGNSFSQSGVTGFNFMLRAVETSSGCSFTLSPSSQSFTSVGGASPFNVSTNAGCQWTAVARDPWVTTSSNGTGSGVVSFAVAPNGDEFTRTGFISIGDQVFTITESAGDQLSIQTLNLSLAAGPSDEVCRLNSPQIQVTVPSNALQLNVGLVSSDITNNDVDLYMNFNRAVVEPGPQATPFTADFISNGPSGQEAIKVGPFTTPPLQAGTYFIAVANCKAFTVSATLTITMTKSPACSFGVTPGTLAFTAAGGQSSAGVSRRRLFVDSIKQRYIVVDHNRRRFRVR